MGPDGAYVTHDKDIPTLWEGCYYAAGADDGLATMGTTQVGMAMCWELMRHQTARRLRGQVDVLVAGSCWPSRGTSRAVNSVFPHFEAQNAACARDAPGDMARLVGAPIVHAGHCGPIRMRLPIVALTWEGRFAGESQICAADGAVVARRTAEDGPGIVIADIALGRTAPTASVADDFWIYPLREPIPLMWAAFNRHAARRRIRHAPRAR